MSDGVRLFRTLASLLAATAALCLLSRPAPGQLPPVPIPAENPLTPQKAVLGKILFWDEQLSHDGSVACGTCHMPERGGTDARLLLAATPVHPGPDGVYGTDDDRRGSPGVLASDVGRDFVPDPLFGLHRQVTPRLANPTIGAAWHSLLFWDGRATSAFTDPESGQVLIPFGGALESQSLAPILSPVEMGQTGRDWNDVRTRLATVQPLALATNLPADVQAALAAHPSYADLFRAAYGDPAITAARIAFALASYQRTLVPDQTPWDLFQQGNQNALTPDQQTGLAFFLGGARCTNCHAPPLFTDDAFHNLGLRPWTEDPGRMGVTGVFAERGAFKTPTLRNAGLRPRMLHDGSMPALGSPEGVTAPHSMVNLYFFGGGAFRENIDPFVLQLQNLGITKSDLRLVEEFVRVGLTDPRVAQALPPFDRPTLRAERVAARSFGPALAQATGGAPFLLEPDPAFPGNRGFRLGLAADAPGAFGLLAWSLASHQPALLVGGIPIHLAGAWDGRWFVLGGAPGGPGHATWHLPIPPITALSGLDVYFQWLVADPLQATGAASSRGLQVPLR